MNWDILRRSPNAVSVLPMQRDFMACTKKMSAIRGGVGSAKSFICSYKMLMRMQRYPRAQHFVIGADYQQLKRGFLRTFEGVLQRHKIKYGRSLTDGTITLKGGARLECLSAELDERIRSLEADSVYCEEPQTWKNGAGEGVFETLIERLRPSPSAVVHYPDLSPQLWMSFNPPAVGSWLYNLIEKKWAGIYPCWRFSVRDNTLMPGQQEYIELLEQTLDRERWPSEIDGEWASVGAGVYRGFDADIHGVAPEGLPPIALDENAPLLWALDFNVGHMASVVCQAHVQKVHHAGWDNQLGKVPKAITRRTNEAWQRRVVYVLDEIFLRDSGTPDVVNEFLRRHGDHARRTGVRVYGDASGSARAQTISAQEAAVSNWEIVVDMLRAAGIAVETFVPLANPSIMDRVNAVRAQFNIGGFGLLVDLLKCPELVADFYGVHWVPGKNEIDKTDKSASGLRRTHASDAFGYLVYVERCLASRQPLNLRDFMLR